MENPERSQVTGTLKVSPSYFHTSLNTEHIHNLSRILIRTEGWRGAGLPPARLLQGQISLKSWTGTLVRYYLQRKKYIYTHHTEDWRTGLVRWCPWVDTIEILLLLAINWKGNCTYLRIASGGCHTSVVKWHLVFVLRDGRYVHGLR